MSHHDELLQIIREVRSRWRWKVVLRSVTVLVGAAILALLAVAYGLEQFRFSPAAIVASRVVMYVVLVALGWFFFVRPLGRRVSDQQVALYLEEHEPSLQEAAGERRRRRRAGPARRAHRASRPNCCDSW